MTRRMDAPAWVLSAGLMLAAVAWAVEPRQEITAASTPSAPAFGTADSNDRMIAVTGVDVTGSSVLYIVDTLEKRLSVYQAYGGSRNTAGIRWVGARNIGLDFAVDGWNDHSEVSYKDLRAKLETSAATTDR